MIETIELPADFNYRQLVESETFQAEDDEMSQQAVLSSWIDTSPVDFLGWMESTGSLGEFNRFFDPAHAAKMPEAIRYFAQQDAESRKALLKSVQWSDLKVDEISAFARSLEGTDAQVAWVAKAVEVNLSSKEVDVPAILALIPSVDSQVEALMQVDPRTDWRPDTVPKRGETAIPMPGGVCCHDDPMEERGSRSESPCQVAIQPVIERVAAIARMVPVYAVWHRRLACGSRAKMPVSHSKAPL